MNEQDIRGLADIAVSAGTATREQANQWVASDVAALDGNTPPHAPQVGGAELAMRNRMAADVAAGRRTADDAKAAIELWLSITPEDGGTSQHGSPDAPAEPQELADPLGKLPLDDGLPDRPSHPADYKFPPASSKFDGPTLQAVRDLAWQSRMPQSIATEVFTTADSYVHRYVDSGRPLSDAEYDTLTRTTTAKVHTAYGADAPAKLDQARRFVTELVNVNPKLLDLIGTGLGSDFGFVCHVINAASRLYEGAPPVTALQALNAARGK